MLRVNNSNLNVEYCVFYKNVENKNGLKPVNFQEIVLFVEKGDTETYCELERQFLKDNYVMLQSPEDSKIQVRGMYYISPKEMSNFCEHNILEDHCRIKLSAQIDLIDKNEKIKKNLIKYAPISVFVLSLLVLLLAFLI